MQGQQSSLSVCTVASRQWTEMSRRVHDWGCPSLKALQSLLIMFSEYSPHSVEWRKLCEKPFVTVLEVIQSTSFKTNLCPVFSIVCVYYHVTSHDNPRELREKSITFPFSFIDARHNFNRKLVISCDVFKGQKENIRNSRDENWKCLWSSGPRE